jgi:hypothetical protein
LGTTAFPGSATVPVMVPRSLCASDATVINKQQSAVKYDFIGDPLSQTPGAHATRSVYSERFYANCQGIVNEKIESRADGDKLNPSKLLHG